MKCKSCEHYNKVTGWCTDQKIKTNSKWGTFSCFQLSDKIVNRIWFAVLLLCLVGILVIKGVAGCQTGL